MFTDYQRICSAIRQALDLGRNNFIIYPYGEYGVMTKQILNDSFGIKEAAIIDNRLAAYNVNIKTLSECQNLEKSKYTVLFTCANPDVYYEALNNLMQYFSRHFVIEIFQMEKEKRGTRCGKYSYGPLCNHWLIESVGAFCSFAEGTDVVENHAVGYISTHPFLYLGGTADNIREKRWDEWEGCQHYFAGITPRGENYKLRKIHIGWE